jgi:hypothetical protein
MLKPVLNHSGCGLCLICFSVYARDGACRYAVIHEAPHIKGSFLTSRIWQILAQNDRFKSRHFQILKTNENLPRPKDTVTVLVRLDDSFCIQCKKNYLLN